MIKDISEKPNNLEIDLTGPNGNAFVLLGYARRFAKQLDKDPDEITNRMKSGNYDNLIAVFEKEFGEFITLYR